MEGVIISLHLLPILAHHLLRQRFPELKTSIGKLDEAGLSPSDVASASSSLVGTMVGSLDEGGLAASDLSGAVETITSGATSAIGEVSGISVSELSSVIEGITSGATGALDDISLPGYSSDNLSNLVEKVTSGSTSALGKMKLTASPQRTLKMWLKSNLRGWRPWVISRWKDMMQVT